MPIQVGKMILFGILYGIIYIAVPLILFEVLGMMGIMTFTQEFKISIIIMGAVGVFFAMLSHAYPKDTSANRIIAFFSTVFSGIYLFYIFGGFDPGVSLGTYYIEIATFQILFGLQLIAWLFLGSSGIRALQFLVEAIELHKKKEYNVRVKKQFKLSKLFKFFGTILSLVILGYFVSLIYSGMNLGFAINPINPLDITYEDGGTLSDPSDDALYLPLTFDLDNQGIYAIYDVHLDVKIYVISSANITLLPPGNLIGQSLNKYFGTYHSFTTYPDQLINISISGNYAFGLATTTANLELRIYFNTQYAGIKVDFNTTIPLPWSP
jgi:MFS family permease